MAYLHRANHGQFNAVWGDRDRGIFNSLLLNRAPLLTAEAQQGVTKALVASFLHAALRDEAAYRALFRNPPAGSAWLPPGHVVTQLREEATIVVDDVGDRVDRDRATAGRDVEVAVDEQLLRDGTREQGNRALRLTWSAGTRPTYAIGVGSEEAARWAATSAHALTFALASVPGAAPPTGLVVELDVAGGASARLALGAGAPLVPSLPAHLVKARWLYGRKGFPSEIRPEEVVLQTFTLPLAAFASGEPSFDPAGLSAIRFTFEGEVAGEVYFDEVGLVHAP